MADLHTLTIAEARALLDKGETTAEELAKNVLARAEKENKAIGAYLELFDDVLAQAKAADKAIKEGTQSALTGIPLAIKDNILIKGKTASAASKILEGYTAVYDATVIDKLKKEHAVFLGRANMDEFAMGSSTENSGFAVTKNPRDTSRVPGGSSGGSAAAVAMGGALAALGSDTGGSIRQPAAFCGVVGLKPTYGTVSRHGLMAMASSLDQIGPLAKSVGDARVLYDAVKGHDPMDSTSLPEIPVAQGPDKELTIGIPTDFINSEGVDAAVIENFNNTINALKGAGYKTKEISLADLKSALAAYYVIMPAEVSSNLARFDGIRYGVAKHGASGIEDYTKTRGEGFGKEVRRRILLGTFVLSSGYYDAYYRSAIRLRMHIRSIFNDAFKDVDLVAVPTTPTPAFKVGEKTSDPLQMYLADIFTVPVNLAGIPAISVPSGTVAGDGTDLPLGIQFIAPAFGEELLFRAGGDIEQLMA